jgi:serine protease Do
MRFTQLLALAAVAGTATNTLGAQDSRASAEVRARAVAPSVYRIDRWDDGPSNRAAIGIGTGTSGTLRDTLGLLVTSITKGSPAEKAGLEEGNRIAAINGVNLRVAAADVEDGEMSGAVTRRLTRELAKSKPGDEVDLRVYRDGKFSNVKIKTASSDDLFGRSEAVRATSVDRENRPTLGIGIGSTGSRRDTLGVLIMSVSDSSPAARAGLEEGNRIAAINGVNLRVAREDAGDRYLGSTKASRLQREISQLKVGDNVTLRVYSNGQFRDVTLKVARAGDLPRNSGGVTIFGGDGFFPGMTMPAMPSMPSMPRGGVYIDRMPDVDGLRTQLETIRPQLEMIRPQLEMMRPQIERLRMEAPRTRMQIEGVSRARTLFSAPRAPTSARVMVAPRAKTQRMVAPRLITPRARIVNVRV